MSITYSIMYFSIISTIVIIMIEAEALSFIRSPHRCKIFLSLSQINNDYFAVYEQFLRSQGRDRLMYMFPSSYSLINAFNKEDSDATQDKTMIACSQYHHGKSFMNSSSVHLIYHSHQEDICCFSFDSSLLQNFDSYSSLLSFAVPLPRLLKLDVSVLATFYWSERNQLTSVNECSVDVESAFHQLLCHPIIHDLPTNNRLELSISFESSTTTEIMTSLASLWQMANLPNDAINKWNPAFESSSSSDAFRRLSPHERISSKKGELIIHHSSMSPQDIAYHETLSSMWTSLLRKSGDSVQHCRWEDTFDSPQYRHEHILVQLKHSHESFIPRSHCFFHFVTMIAESSAVTRLAVSSPLRLLNNNVRGLVESGFPNVEPLSSVGLTGQDIIIGIADTGIDENSCFFRDDNLGMIPRSLPSNPLVDFRYRKIIQYVNYSESNGDYSQGHGSHVSGTAAGQCIDPSSTMSVYNGVASASKIAFFDIGAKAGYLVVPSNLELLYQVSYDTGARIQSHSWGGSFLYDTYCLETDKFLYNNDDFVVIYAAGNVGMTSYSNI